MLITHRFMLTAAAVLALVAIGGEYGERSHEIDSSPDRGTGITLDLAFDHIQWADAGRSNPASIDPGGGDSRPADLAALVRYEKALWPTPLPPAPPIEDTLCSYPWDCVMAAAIIYGPTAACPTGESAGDSRAVGEAGERGLMQILSIHADRFTARGWSWDDAFDPQRNIAIGYEIWADRESWGRGWDAWSCAP